MPICPRAEDLDQGQPSARAPWNRLELAVPQCDEAVRSRWLPLLKDLVRQCMRQRLDFVMATKSCVEDARRTKIAMAVASISPEKL